MASINYFDVTRRENAHLIGVVDRVAHSLRPLSDLWWGPATHPIMLDPAARKVGTLYIKHHHDMMTGEDVVSVRWVDIGLAVRTASHRIRSHREGAIDGTEQICSTLVGMVGRGMAEADMTGHEHAWLRIARMSHPRIREYFTALEHNMRAGKGSHYMDIPGFPAESMPFDALDDSDKAWAQFCSALLQERLTREHFLVQLDRSPPWAAKAAW
jgi:hypothetical protein